MNLKARSGAPSGLKRDHVQYSCIPGLVVMQIFGLLNDEKGRTRQEGLLFSNLKKGESATEYSHLSYWRLISEKHGIREDLHMLLRSPLM